MINENELVARVCADIDWAIRVARMYAITTNVNYNAVKRLEGIATHLAAWEALMDVLSYIDADGAAFKEKDEQYGKESDELYEHLAQLRNALNDEVNRREANHGTDGKEND